jgi:hypothetical protein
VEIPQDAKRFVHLAGVWENLDAKASIFTTLHKEQQPSFILRAHTACARIVLPSRTGCKTAVAA